MSSLLAPVCGHNITSVSLWSDCALATVLELALPLGVFSLLAFYLLLQRNPLSRRGYTSLQQDEPTSALPPASDMSPRLGLYIAATLATLTAILYAIAFIYAIDPTSSIAFRSLIPLLPASLLIWSIASALAWSRARAPTPKGYQRIALNTFASIQATGSILRLIFSLYTGALPTEATNSSSTPVPIIDTPTGGIIGPAILLSSFIFAYATLSTRSAPHILSSNGTPISYEEGASMIESATFSWMNPLMKKGYSHSFDLEDLWEQPRIDQARYVLSIFMSRSPGSLLRSLIHFHRHELAIQSFFALVWSSAMFISPYCLRILLAFLRKPEDGSSPDAWLATLGLLVGPALMSLGFQRSLHLGRRMGNRYRTALSGEIYAKVLRQRQIARVDSPHSSSPDAHHIDIVDGVNEDGTDAPIPPPSSPEDPRHVGDVTNLLTVDVNKVALFTAYNHYIYASPLQMLLALYLLHGILGWPSALFGLLAVIILYPMTKKVSEIYGLVQDQVMVVTDRRMALIGEILQGIRIVKLFAWEPRFAERVRLIRESELAMLWRRLLATMGFSVLGFGGPILIMLMTFGSYTHIFGRSLDAATAFTSLALFNSLRGAIEAFPDMVVYGIEALVSIERIEKFLAEPEVDPIAEEDVLVTPLDEEEAESSTPSTPREADWVGFSGSVRCVWGTGEAEGEADAADVSTASADTSTSTSTEDKFELRDLSVLFPPCALSVITGPTGSGKTALLMALLGEIKCLSGRVSLPRGPQGDRVAYVPQQPWLQNATIRENILFGTSYDLARYAETVEACALREDFAQLPAGDSTEVGEKGIALSGGQKQRISLARAVYSHSDTVLLDDVLSAVDAHTAGHLYQQCLLGPLMRSRTLILVTHYVDLCVQGAAHVVVLGGGRILHQGSPSLLAHEGVLSDLIAEAEVPKEVEATLEEEVAAADAADTVSTSSTPIPTLDEASAKGKSPVKPAGENTPAPVDATADESTALLGKLTEEEGRSRGGVNRDVYSMYIRYSGGYSFWVGILALFLGTQVLAVLQNYWLRLWVTAYEKADGAEVSITYYLGVYAAIGACIVGLAMLRSLALFSGSIRASRTIHEELLNRVLGARLRYFDVTPVGRLMNRFSKDVEVLDQEVAPVISYFGYAVIETIGVVLVVSMVVPPFLLAAILIALLFYSFSVYYLATSRELKRLESTTKSPLLTLFGETVSGVATVRAFGQQARFMRMMERKVDDSSRPNYLLWASNRWLSWRVDIAGSLVSFSTAALLVATVGEMDAALAGFAMTYALAFTEHMLWVVRMYGANEMNMNSVERLRELLEIEVEPPAIIPGHRPPQSGWPTKGEVEVEELVLSYAENRPPVLKGLSFHIQGGERVGIVGRTGAGKSTLAVAFFRFIEASAGSIRIDGVDIGQIGLRDLRSNLTIIPQDPILFTGSIRSNLDPFNEHEDEAVWEALQRAHLVEGGEERPSGLESLASPVSEHGGNFSQGQRQLLALARALLRQSHLIILDEATASVDFATDARIQETIRTEFRGATLMCIAHRLRTIIDYDRVLVMDAGRMVEFDTPWNLLQSSDGVFRGMCARSGEEAELFALAKAKKEADDESVSP